MNRFKRITTVLVLGLSVIVVVWIILDRWGLREIPEAPAAEQALANPDYQSAIETARSIIANHRLDIGVPALSIAVGVDGKIVWSEAVGWADIENSIPATPETSFRIGSTSKAITASLTARLLDTELISLDVPIDTWMPDLPEKWHDLTLRQLQSHTAGIVGYEENSDWLGALDGYLLWNHYENVADALTIFDNAPLMYTPGESFYYSSFDVVLASAVLQKAGKEDFMSLVRKHVLEPVGMKNTGPDHNKQHPPDRAVFYDRRGDLVKPWRSVDLSSKLASGGFASTSSDLVRLGMAWLGNDFIAHETKNEMWTPQRLKNGEVNEQSYAIGWRVNTVSRDWHEEEFRIVHHGGVSKGSMSWLVLYPKLDIVIAINCNARAEEFGEFARVYLDIAPLFFEVQNQLSGNE